MAIEKFTLVRYDQTSAGAVKAILFRWWYESLWLFLVCSVVPVPLPLDWVKADTVLHGD